MRDARFFWQGESNAANNCILTGPAAQNRAGVPDFRAHLYGRIAHIGETSAARRRRLLEMAEQVDWS
ncbi:MAG: hypothetical protein ACSLE8_25095 [Rhodococcus sp. (in: high G+C Gram-positive bacteria)]